MLSARSASILITRLQARRPARFSNLIRLAFAAAAACVALAPLAPAFAAKQHRVDIAYVAPKDPGHQAIYETLKTRRVLFF